MNKFKAFFRRLCFWIPPILTKQQIFDKVVNHLRKQGCKSENSKYCLYRGPDNTKCAAGCLIPDRLYSKYLEKQTVETPAIKRVLLKAGIYHIGLVKDLQLIHDANLVCNWENEFERVAKQHNLKYSPLSNLFSLMRSTKPFREIFGPT